MTPVFTPPGILRLGVLAVAAYMAVGVVTVRLSGVHVRPLFDGFDLPSGPYRWVTPPPVSAASNVAPKASTRELPLDATYGPITGTPDVQLDSEDTQFRLTLSAGAIFANPGATTVRAAITPLDPARLGPPPPPLVADGNAYRIALTYQPTGRPASVIVPGRLVVIAPSPPEVLLFSAEGQTWQRMEPPVADRHIAGGAFMRPGYYLAAVSVARTPTSTTAEPGSSSNARAFVVAGLSAAVALALRYSPALFRRRRPSASRENEGVEK